jgi:gliding motility-associated-like protein
VVFDWVISSGANHSGINASNTWLQPGLFQVRLIGRTAFGCADTAFRMVRVNPTPVVQAGNDITICRGQNTQLSATGSTNLTWSPAQGLSCTNCSNPQAGPNLTTQYFVTGVNSFGCRNTDSMLVRVAQPFDITVTSNDTICASRNETAQLFASGTFRYQWNPAVGLNAANTPNPVARPASTTTYRVIGLDEENCFTDTAFVTVAVGYNPTVNLPQGTLVVAGTQVLLNAQFTGGPFRRYTWAPDADLSCNNCPTPVATVNVNTRYTVLAETIYGCTASDTTTYTVECQKDQVFIPNAFSPDGDGINDVLMVRGKGVATVKSFRIFNRFGQVVFEKQNFSANDPTAGWNGRINGVPASADVYVYTAEVQCTSGGVNFTYKGNVTLFR